MSIDHPCGGNKGSQGVLEQIQAVENLLPFRLRGFDCDNGSEFLNQHLLRYFTDHPQQPVFTRSRPYKKKRQCACRAEKLDECQAVIWLRQVGQGSNGADDEQGVQHALEPLAKSLLPQLETSEKAQGRRQGHQKYHAPQTPYQRVLDHPDIPKATKNALSESHAKLNPFALKAAIEQRGCKNFCVNGHLVGN